MLVGGALLGTAEPSSGVVVFQGVRADGKATLAAARPSVRQRTTRNSLCGLGVEVRRRTLSECDRLACATRKM